MENAVEYDIETVEMELNPVQSEWRRFISIMVSRKVVAFGTFIIILLVFAAIFAPSISPYSPYKQNLKNVLDQPSREYLLGTDDLGRDVLSRIIFGTRTSLQVGVIAVGIASIAGMTLGLIAGYFGGWVNIITMRFIDALIAVPPIILALTFASTMGGGLTNVMISVGITMMPVYCRLMCGQVLQIKQNDYILANKILGASNIRTMLYHILPNCFPPLIVLITLNMGQAILIEAGLSFLGIGIAPPGAAWGSMVSIAYRYLSSNPILSFAPGLCIMLVVFSFNMVGDGLRDALDPRLRGVI